MDKSWIPKPRNSIEYEQGVRGFLDFAFEHRSVNGKIICPCKRCHFKKWKSRDEVYDHLICTPFPAGYTSWSYHGESATGETHNASFINPSNSAEGTTIVEDPVQNMINDAFGVDRHRENEVPIAENVDIDMDEEETTPASQERLEADEFYELARDGEQPLYEGCTKYSRLSFLVKLYHIKCLSGVSDKAMTMILELLNDAFEHAKIPSSFYEAKKTISKLGLNYEKIDACKYHCMLYWGNKEDEEREICKNCQTSRWKSSGDGSSGKKVPKKVLRYFPLKPRLQRLFLSTKTAEDMRWHASNTNNDGLMRHPRDSKAWEEFDKSHGWFAQDPRNVRLALASDGFNPYGTMSTSHSIWPVILIPYNTPPWVCMKQSSFILSLIIPGKKNPGNNIDVYLQPLIKELKELWTTGVDAYDSFKREMFKLHAAVMWTISDLPGLSALSGWNTYTGLACPSCNFDFIRCRLPHSQKSCFMGHRRFLDRKHKFRFNRVRFNGEQDLRDPPKTPTGYQIFEQVRNIKVTFGGKPKKKGDAKGKRKRRRNEQVSQGGTEQWKKCSIFFDLPYWKDNQLRHNLDMMHIEKNVCENLIFTLLNDSGKSKDHLKARKDLEAMDIRPDLWPDENGKYPLAVFTMTNVGKNAFLKTLKNITVPDGYSSNISRCIDLNTNKLSGMLKSHDFHILLEQLLPLAMRSTLPDEVTTILMEFCSFFRKLSGKVLKVEDLDKWQDQIILTLCHMEMLFPPSFFTVSVHLVVHLVEEIKLGGPVHYRWMYPIER